MFVDARQAAENSIVDCDLCIVGGGVAGLALALHFDGQPLKVCIIEGGGFRKDADEQDLYRGENVGLPYAGLETVRSRYLGGSSNCWGGWCRPFDDWDFERREWVPHSGWPFGKAELLPYYARAHRLLALGRPNYDPANWEQGIARPDARRLPIDDQRFTTLINQFSPPVRFGRDYRAQLRYSKNLQVWLHANACELFTDCDGNQVTALKLRTLSGRQFTARARCFVLAAGGIENARLLLLSHRQQAAGLGNRYDLVGRFFMEHPRVRVGKLRLASAQAARFYDVKYNYHSRRLRAEGISVAAHLAPTRALQAREQLLNARIYFASLFAGEESWPVTRLRRAVEQPSAFAPFGVLSRKAHALVNYAYTRVPWPESLVRERQLEIVIESAPNPHSRITLAEQRDALGLNRVRLDWRLGALERRSLHRLQRLLATEIERHRLGHIETALEGEVHAWPQMGWCWHHMGTTRMHDDPRQGVVDRHCRVHDLSNLYIAGSSVFPTCGSDMPTLTIAALAFRLADRLEAQLLRRMSIPAVDGAAQDTDELSAAAAGMFPPEPA